MKDKDYEKEEPFENDIVENDNAENEIPTIKKGFDRDIDYTTIKKKLLKELKKRINEYKKICELPDFLKKQPRIIHKIIYLLTCIIQLRNGSRISEAVDALFIFFNKHNDNLKNKVIVKIAKSSSIKCKKGTQEKFKTKTRWREIIFPKWYKISDFIIKHVKHHLKSITKNRLKKNVLDFLLLNYECNTHSLRYAFINYMLYEKKIEMPIIAKFVGHVNTNQLVTYTQMKNCNKIFDMDI